MQQRKDLKALVASDLVSTKIQELLGDNKAAFVTSLMQCVSSNNMLKQADPVTVINAAMTAASIGLPINNNLGHAYIVPYNNNVKLPDGQWVKKTEAQFQIGYKGVIQLALRTNQYHKINAVPVYENQFTSWNSLREQLIADFEIEGKGEPVGYVSYFRLLSGFEKVLYWPKSKVEVHGQKYSKSYSNTKGRWKLDFDGMALKTVLKASLSKYGPLSVEMQKALEYDQSVQRNFGEPEYIDNPLRMIDGNGNTIPDVSNTKILEMINNATSNEELDMLLDSYKHEVTRDIQLVSAVGAKRKSFENEG